MHVAQVNEIPGLEAVNLSQNAVNEAMSELRQSKY
jgi:hypothetical protein